MKSGFDIRLSFCFSAAAVRIIILLKLIVLPIAAVAYTDFFYTCWHLFFVIYPCLIIVVVVVVVAMTGV
jgi:hypothetical protein